MNSHRVNGCYTVSVSISKHLHHFNLSQLLLPLIFIITFLAFSNTLTHGFVWDDASYIIDWHQVHNFGISDFLTGAQPGFHSGVYRPIRNLLYPIAFQYCGLNPFCYHFQAILLHLLVVLLVYKITIRLTSLPTLSALTALLFALHPIHVEAVAWVTASFDMVSIIFALSSFYFYLLAASPPLNIRGGRGELSPQHTVPINDTFKTKLLYKFKLTHHQLYLISLSLSFLAFFSNEATLVLPLLILSHKIIYSPAFKDGPSKQQWIDMVNSFTSKIKLDLNRSNTSILGYFILASIYLPIHLIFMGNSWRHLTINLTLLQRLLLPIYTYFEYLLTLVWPTNLSINHLLTSNLPALYYLDKGLTPIPLPLNPYALLITAVLITIIIIAITVRRSLPLFTFGISWLFISLLPVSQLFPQAVLFSERYAYFASIGFCLVLATLIASLSKFPKLHSGTIKPVSVSTSITIVIAIIVSGFYLYQTYTYNQVWQSDLTLWSHDLHQHPASASALNGVGSGYLQAGDPQSALPYFQQAAAANPAILIYQTNYINTLEKAGDTTALISTLEQFLGTHPNSPEALTRLIRAYTSIGNTQQVTLYQQRLNQLNISP